MPKTTVLVPKRMLEEFVTAGQRLNAAADVLEDFLLTTDAQFIRKMRRLRSSHRRGQLLDWQKLKAG